MRPPLSICMQDEDDFEATTYVAANLLHMYGADCPDFKSIDRELGPDQTLRGHIAMFLLRRNFHMRVIGTHDPHQFALKGVEYTQSHLHTNGAPIEPLARPLAMKLRRQNDAVLDAYVEAGDRVECILLDPELSDITQAVAHGKTVLLAWGSDGAPVLAYGIEGRQIKLWYPYWDQPCLQSVSYRRFADQWQSQIGIEIFWR